MQCNTQTNKNNQEREQEEERDFMRSNPQYHPTQTRSLPHSAYTTSQRYQSR
jgi:hypothetical protein